jgi:hypothetical protein
LRVDGSIDVSRRIELQAHTSSRLDRHRDEMQHGRALRCPRPHERRMGKVDAAGERRHGVPPFDEQKPARDATR